MYNTTTIIIIIDTDESGLIQCGFDFKDRLRAVAIGKVKDGAHRSQTIFILDLALDDYLHHHGGLSAASYQMQISV